LLIKKIKKKRQKERDRGSQFTLAAHCQKPEPGAALKHFGKISIAQDRFYSCEKGS